MGEIESRLSLSEVFNEPDSGVDASDDLMDIGEAALLSDVGVHSPEDLMDLNDLKKRFEAALSYLTPKSQEKAMKIFEGILKGENLGSVAKTLGLSATAIEQTWRQICRLPVFQFMPHTFEDLSKYVHGELNFYEEQKKYEVIFEKLENLLMNLQLKEPKSPEEKDNYELLRKILSSSSEIVMKRNQNNLSTGSYDEVLARIQALCDFIIPKKNRRFNYLYKQYRLKKRKKN